MKNSLAKFIDSVFFNNLEDLFSQYNLGCINYEESHWSSVSNDTETVISYVMPGVEKSQLRVKIEQEDGESILVVEVSERKGGGIGSKAKSSKFYFFPGEIPEKTSSELKDGVLTIRIPKEVNKEEPKKTILEIPIK